MFRSGRDNSKGDEDVGSDDEQELEDLGAGEEKDRRDQNDEEEEDEDVKQQSSLDKCLFVWNLMMLLLCLLLIMVGIILRYKFTTFIMRDIEEMRAYPKYSHFVRFESVPDELIFGNLVSVLGNSLIMLNASYFLCILLYMSHLIHSNTYTLPIVILLTGSAILAEINIINVHMSPVSAANEESTAILKEQLAHQYAIDDSAAFSVTYDILAIWGGCCGIMDQFDFQDMELKYIKKATGSDKLQVPPTCCTRAVFEKETEDVLECATKAENIYSKGCYVVLYNWLRRYCNIYSLIIIIKLIDMCVHIVLFKTQVRRYRRIHTMTMKRYDFASET